MGKQGSHRPPTPAVPATRAKHGGQPPQTGFVASTGNSLCILFYISSSSKKYKTFISLQKNNFLKNNVSVETMYRCSSLPAWNQVELFTQYGSKVNFVSFWIEGAAENVKN